MDGSAIRMEVSDAVERSPGVRQIYRVPHPKGSGTFVAKWRFDNARIASGNLSHAMLTCRTAGTATLTRQSRGSFIRRRPAIGSVTYVAQDTPALFTGEGSCEVCHVYLAEDALRRFAGDVEETTFPRMQELFAVEDPWLRGYFQLLMSEFELFASDEQRADLLFVAQAEHLLIRHLVRWHSDSRARDRGCFVRREGVNPLGSAKLRRVQEYIAANLAGDIALPELATIACMSVGHFMRSFRAAVGTTPYHYVLEQRLRQACSLLRTTSLPVSRIAAQSGFKTPSQLSAKFRARLGASPSQYRTSAKSGSPRPLAVFRGSDDLAASLRVSLQND